MSFASAAGESAVRLFNGGNFARAAGYVGVVLGAGALGAVYQLAHDEGRGFIQNLRHDASVRRHRNERLLLLLFRTELPLELRDRLRRSRNVFNASLRLLTDKALPPDQHRLIHAALTELQAGEAEE
jgi:hypothetical protein